MLNKPAGGNGGGDGKTAKRQRTRAPVQGQWGQRVRVGEEGEDSEAPGRDEASHCEIERERESERQ